MIRGGGMRGWGWLCYRLSTVNCGIGHTTLLIVDLVVHSIVGLFLLCAKEVPDHSDSLASEDKGSSNSGLAGGDQSKTVVTAAVGLLVLAGVGAQDMVPALETLVVW